MIGEETERCSEGENRKKREHLSDGRGGFETPPGLNNISYCGKHQLEQKEI